MFASTARDQFLIRATGGVGLGTNAPANQLTVVESINATALGANHVVQFINPAAGGPDVLALTNSSVLTPGIDANFITFFGSNPAVSLGAIQGNGAGGVVYVGPGNDFAEYLPKQLPGETLSPGDIVGLHAGQVSRVTHDADQVLVLSTAPLIAGNAPTTGDPASSTLALVTLIGQTRVRVVGPVAAGSFILPSGQNDGLGLAVLPEDLTLAQAAGIAGQALESASGDGPHLIDVAVGLPRDNVWAGLLANHAVDPTAGQKMSRDLTRLAEQNASLEARLQSLEQRPAGPAFTPLAALPWLLLAGSTLFILGLLLGRRRA